MGWEEDKVCEQELCEERVPKKKDIPLRSETGQDIKYKAHAEMQKKGITTS